jgi:phospholipid/cholesterol/gamma-HCH transport system permease protein
VLSRTGALALDILESLGRAAALLAESLRALRYVHRYTDRVMEEIFQTGIAAVPVVSLTTLFVGMILAVETGTQIGGFEPASSALGGIVGTSVIRELGPLLAALCIAGFVGGSITSTIGTMRINEEIDAMEMMSVDPVRYLVMPRIVGMMIAVPLLTALGDLLGILGGCLVARYQFNIAPADYYASVKDSATLGDLLFGLSASLVFGVVIAALACSEGYHASGGARGVGRATMRAVVVSFLMVIVIEYLMMGLLLGSVFGR